MNGVTTFLNHPAVLRWGWVLMHFLWQGLLVSLLAWGLLTICAGKSARVRYLLATGCLLLALFCPLATWFSLEEPSATVEIRNENVDSVSPSPSSLSQNVAQPTPIATESDWESSVDDSLSDVSTIPAVSIFPTSSEIPQESSWKTYLESSLPWIVSAWLLGVLILSLRLAGGWFVARRCVSKGVPLREEWALRVPEFIARLKLSRSIYWIESSRIRVPQVMGWLKPVVLVPSSMFTTLSPAEIECLLLHELVHIRRYDYLVNLIQCVIETLFFYHPGVRWLSRRIRLERELACDEAVVLLTEDKMTFSRALLSLADLVQLPKPALAATEGDLTVRIRALLGMKHRGSLVGVAVWLCLAVCVLTLGVLFVPDSQASSQRDRAVEAEEQERDASATNKRDEDGGDESSFAHLLGKVIDKEGNPVAGADVHTSLGGENYSSISGSNGEFSLDVPRPEPLRRPRSLLVFAEMDNGRLQGTAFIPFDINQDQQPEPTEIILQPAREFGVVVRDIAGEPVSGATVRLMSNSGKLDEETSDAEGRALLVVPADLPLRSIVAFKKGVGIDYEEFESGRNTNLSLLSKDAENPVQFSLQPCRPVTVHVVDDQQQPVAGARVSFPFVSGIPGFSGLSDDIGNITFEMVPWNITGAREINIIKAGYLDMDRTYFHPEATDWEVTAELVSKISVKGQVTMPDGQPVADAEVRARGANYTGPNPESIDLGRTNADGQFEFLLPPMMYYSFMARKDNFISRPQELIIYDKPPAEPLRLQLAAATRVRGRVSVGNGREPLADQRIGFGLQPQQSYADLAGRRKLPDPQNDGSRWSLNAAHYGFKTTTDPQGRFEVMLGPGTYHLGDPGSYGKPYLFKVEGGRELELDVYFPREKRKASLESRLKAAGRRRAAGREGGVESCSGSRSPGHSNRNISQKLVLRC